jgi:hypothetical protein
MSDKKQSIRFATINNFVDAHLSTCQPAEIAVYLVIWRYVREGTTEIGHQQLAEITGLSERSTKRAVKALAAKGIIRLLRKGNNLMNKPNRYAITNFALESRGDSDDTLQTIPKRVT